MVSEYSKTPNEHG